MEQEFQKLLKTFCNSLKKSNKILSIQEPSNFTVLDVLQSYDFKKIICDDWYIDFSNQAYLSLLKLLKTPLKKLGRDPNTKHALEKQNIAVLNQDKDFKADLIIATEEVKSDEENFLSNYMTDVVQNIDDSIALISVWKEN